MDTFATFLFLAIVLATAVAAVLLTARLLAPKATQPGDVQRRLSAGQGDVVRSYHFREGYLLSDLDKGDAFLDPETDRAIALERLSTTLSPLGPDVAQGLSDLHTRGTPFLVDARIGSDPLTISGRMEDGNVEVISVAPGQQGTGRQIIETATLEAMRTELDDTRMALDANDAAMWRESAEGAVVWANAAYVNLVVRLRGGDTPGWPLPRIFASQLEPVPTDGTLRRCILDIPDRDEASWFEVGRDALGDGSSLFHAQPSDRLVRAETGLREFMQTLTKTFASLPIGLAVFDKRRELVTFNPALVTLTAVEPEFLIGRPDLRAFLDRLRDRQRMPEPRDYRSWRDEIAQLEEQAEDGTYLEMWELPGGVTFRVTGRPHPDGAIAFMFEDLSAEVSLTRKFRGDLDLWQAVLDTSPDAIAIFDGEGAMVGANVAYRRLWNDDPMAMDTPTSLARASALWSAQCQPTGLWGEIRQFIGHDVERAPWSEEIERLDGERLMVRMAPARGRFSVLHFIRRDHGWTDPLDDLPAAPAENGAMMDPVEDLSVDADNPAVKTA